MKKRFMLTLVCLMAAISWVAAQNSPITGIVISAEDNEPIIGASVLVKGSTTGAVTDLDGKFTITDAPAGATTLQVSFVGMITQEVPITPGTIRVTLKNDAKLLDEVVVTTAGPERGQRECGHFGLELAGPPEETGREGYGADPCETGHRCARCAVMPAGHD